jgi:hypothetical protein
MLYLCEVLGHHLIIPRLSDSLAPGGATSCHPRCRDLLRAEQSGADVFVVAVEGHVFHVPDSSPLIGLSSYDIIVPALGYNSMS